MHMLTNILYHNAQLLNLTLKAARHMLPITKSKHYLSSAISWYKLKTDSNIHQQNITLLNAVIKVTLYCFTPTYVVVFPVFLMVSSSSSAGNVEVTSTAWSSNEILTLSTPLPSKWNNNFNHHDLWRLSVFFKLIMNHSASFCNQKTNDTEVLTLLCVHIMVF